MKWLTYPRYIFLASALVVLGLLLVAIDRWVKLGVVAIVSGILWHIVMLLAEAPDDDDDWNIRP